MSDKSLVGQNYTPPDLVAKVTGRAKYAEDYRAEGMLFTKLLLSPMPHARVRSIDTRAALAMPGVKAILTVDDMPKPADAMTDLMVGARCDRDGRWRRHDRRVHHRLVAILQEPARVEVIRDAVAVPADRIAIQTRNSIVLVKPD
jgi:CO/xanthine dehydrogenase Mo-binding subunit